MNKIAAPTTIRALDAVAFMNWQFGQTFNGMITMNFKDLGLTTEREACRAVTAMNEAIADKLRRFCVGWDTGYSYCFLYVHEDVATPFGHHAHQLVGMPRGLGESLDAWLKDWARRSFQCNEAAEAIQFKAGYPKGLQACVEQQSRLVRYVLKSSENATVHGLRGQPTTLHTVLEAERHKRAYCAAVRKPAGSSQNIARKAQLTAGFSGPQHLEEVFTEEYLRSWEVWNRGRELTRQLAAINC